jgi:septum formation inhibitor-activating ATPase MinD
MWNNTYLILTLLFELIDVVIKYCRLQGMIVSKHVGNIYLMQSPNQNQKENMYIEV